MPEYASFIHGGVRYPIPAAGSGVGGAGSNALRDIDPFIFYLLEYFTHVLNTHMGTRMVAEATGCSATDIEAAVALQLPLNPEPYLLEETVRFPLLAAARKETTFRYGGQRKIAIDTVEVAYVLPPLERAHAEHLLPFLKAAAAILDNRAEQGFDPTYAPTMPAGTAGDLVWGRAGVAKVECTGYKIGGYSPTERLYFPAVLLTFTAEERSEVYLPELDTYAGAEAIVEIADVIDGSTVEELATVRTLPAPVLVGPLDPATGTKAGGTSVAIPCTGLVVGRPYRVLFAGSDAASVLATSTTELTCLTPQMDAYPSRTVDVQVIDGDGQASNVLEGAYEYTTP